MIHFGEDNYSVMETYNKVDDWLFDSFLFHIFSSPANVHLAPVAILQNILTKTFPMIHFGVKSFAYLD